MAIDVFTDEWCADWEEKLKESKDFPVYNKGWEGDVACIIQPDPEKGLHIRENLLARCQECHPDATVNFSDAWLSHYIPSQEKNSLVYFVDLFYKIFIPGTLGGMAVLVLLDIGSKVRSRRGETGEDIPEIAETTEYQERQSEESFDLTEAGQCRIYSDWTKSRRP